MRHLLILIISILLPLNALCFDGNVVINGINYHIRTKAKTAEVIKQTTGYSGSIIIPSTIEYEDVVCEVRSIGDDAFSGCLSLESVEIPSTVTTIGKRAFSSCYKLSNINIPKSVKTIGSDAFALMTSSALQPKLECVRIDDITSWCNIEFSNISANPLVLAQHLLVGNEEVKNLVIPESIQSILPYTFAGFKSLESVQLNNSVTSIGSCSFANCINLVSLAMPNTVKEIGKYCFYNCKSLKSIQIPEGLSKIEMNTFEYCNSLKEIYIPNSVTAIAEYAFRYCGNLTKIYLGSNLKKVGWNAFSYCTEMTDVYSYAETPPTLSSSINDSFRYSYPEEATLHVPTGCVDAYSKNSIWKQFGNIIEMTDEETDVNTPVASHNTIAVGTYDITGRRVNSNTTSIRIVKMSDGTVRKLVKKP